MNIRVDPDSVQGEYGQLCLRREQEMSGQDFIDTAVTDDVYQSSISIVLFPLLNNYFFNF